VPQGPLALQLLRRRRGLLCSQDMLCAVWLVHMLCVGALLLAAVGPCGAPDSVTVCLHGTMCVWLLVCLCAVAGALAGVCLWYHCAWTTGKAGIYRSERSSDAGSAGVSPLPPFCAPGMRHAAGSRQAMVAAAEGCCVEPLLCPAVGVSATLDCACTCLPRVAAGGMYRQAPGDCSARNTAATYPRGWGDPPDTGARCRWNGWLTTGADMCCRAQVAAGAGAEGGGAGWPGRGDPAEETPSCSLPQEVPCSPPHHLRCARCGVLCEGLGRHGFGCHAVLCCAVLCCAVLCCAVLCCAVLYRAVFESVEFSTEVLSWGVHKRMRMGVRLARGAASRLWRLTGDTCRPCPACCW
jgi:hypothetical protein